MTFNALTINAVRELKDIEVKEDDADSVDVGIEKTIEILKKNFISGKGYTEGGVVDIEAGDMDELPIEVINNAVSFLVIGRVTKS